MHEPVVQNAKPPYLRNFPIAFQNRIRGVAVEQLLTAGFREQVIPYELNLLRIYAPPVADFTVIPLEPDSIMFGKTVFPHRVHRKRIR